MLTWTSLIFSLIILDNEEIYKDSFLISNFICIFLILVPAKLFEFRYLTYCVISLLIIIHYHSAKWKDIYYFIFNKYNFIWLCLVNIVTFYVFIKKPFVNTHWASNEISRFMW